MRYISVIPPPILLIIGFIRANVVHTVTRNDMTIRVRRKWKTNGDFRTLLFTTQARKVYRVGGIRVGEPSHRAGGDLEYEREGRNGINTRSSEETRV